MTDPCDAQPGCRGCVVYDETLTAYDFGRSHPMNPVRVDLTVALAGRLGVLDRLATVAAPDATEDDLETVHDPELIEAVMRAGADPSQADALRGLGSDDNPTFLHMHEAGRHVVGASLEAARRVWTGEVDHAANIAGGLHHAMPDRVSGFCVYNDVAVAIRWLLANGAKKVAYVDVDVHHGDGVEQIFWDDPRVLTISLHETGQMLFPGTGFPQDSGGPDALGSAVNVALPPGTADAGWLRAFHAVVPPLLREFAPDVLVTQQGCDSHREDPLAHLALTVDGQRASYLALHDLAHEVGRRSLGGLRRRRVRRGRRRAALLDPPARHRLRVAAALRPRDPAGLARARPRAARRTRPVADDRRPQRGVPGLVERLRPGHLARPRDPGHPRGGLPLQRARPALLSARM